MLEACKESDSHTQVRNRHGPEGEGGGKVGRGAGGHIAFAMAFGLRPVAQSHREVQDGRCASEWWQLRKSRGEADERLALGRVRGAARLLSCPKLGSLRR
jgi:hypothetical protein